MSGAIPAVFHSATLLRVLNVFDSSLTLCQRQVSQSTRLVLQNEILGSLYVEVD